MFCEIWSTDIVTEFGRLMECGSFRFMTFTFNVEVAVLWRAVILTIRLYSVVDS